VRYKWRILRIQKVRIEIKSQLLLLFLFIGCCEWAPIRLWWPWVWSSVQSQMSVCALLCLTGQSEVKAAGIRATRLTRSLTAYRRPSCFCSTWQAAYLATHHEMSSLTRGFIDHIVTGGGLELYRRFIRDTDAWPTFSRIPALLSIPHTDLISHLWKHEDTHTDTHRCTFSITLSKRRSIINISKCAQMLCHLDWKSRNPEIQKIWTSRTSSRFHDGHVRCWFSLLPRGWLCCTDIKLYNQ